MAKIIEKHDYDKNYIFTCPVCGTVFTERERNIRANITLGECANGIPIRCPNCGISAKCKELKEY